MIKNYNFGIKDCFKMNLWFLVIFLSGTSWVKGEGEGICDPVFSHLEQYGVATPKMLARLPSNGSKICGGGPCCLPSMTEALKTRGRRLLQDVVQKESHTLMKAVKQVKASFTESIEKILMTCEHQSIDTFHRLYPKLATQAKKPTQELFASMRASLNATKGGIVEHALSNFWNDLFPLVYHSTVHSNLAPFSPHYLDCLKESNSNINPWQVVPKLIGEGISKGLNTARLMIQVLTTTYEVISKTKDYEIPEECGGPSARLYFCSACHGSNAPPCFGLCTNVARGCLAPLMEIDGAWNELGTAAGRVEESIKTSRLVELLKDLPDQFSEAIMIAMQSGSKLQKLVRKHCGPHIYDESGTTASIIETSSHSNIMDFGTLEDWGSAGEIFSLRSSEAAAVLSGSRDFWLKLTDSICGHLDETETSCWNGFTIDEYTRPLADYGVSAQKYNPEVQISHPDTSVYALAERLRLVEMFVTKDLNWMPESDSYRSDRHSGSYEGSGVEPTQGRFPTTQDDEDDEDGDTYGEGSGLYPKVFLPDTSSSGRNNDGGDEETSPEISRSNIVKSNCWIAATSAFLFVSLFLCGL